MGGLGEALRQPPAPPRLCWGGGCGALAAEPWAEPRPAAAPAAACGAPTPQAAISELNRIIEETKEVQDLICGAAAASASASASAPASTAAALRQGPGASRSPRPVSALRQPLPPQLTQPRLGAPAVLVRSAGLARAPAGESPLAPAAAAAPWPGWPGCRVPPPLPPEPLGLSARLAALEAAAPGTAPELEASGGPRSPRPLERPRPELGAELEVEALRAELRHWREACERELRGVREELGRLAELPRRLLAWEREFLTLRDQVTSGAWSPKRGTVADRLDSLERALDDSEQAQQTRATQHNSVHGRLCCLEKAMDETIEKHEAEVTAARSKLEQMHGRVAECELHGRALKDLSTVAQRVDSLETLLGDSSARHVTELKMAERVDSLETLLGGLSARHVAELDALKAQHARHEELLSGRFGAPASPGKGTRGQGATLAERLSYIEGFMSDSAEKCATDLLTAHAKIDQLHGRLAACERHAERERAEDRLERLERAAGEVVDRQREELATEHANAELLQARVLACERQAANLADLNKAHAGLAGQLAERGEDHAAMAERLDCLEAAVGDSADKHGAELDLIMATQSKHEALLARHGRELEALRGLPGEHAGAAERLRAVEGRLGDGDAGREEAEELRGRLAAWEQQAASLGDLRTAHATLASGRLELEERHSSLRERVRHLEALVVGGACGAAAGSAADGLAGVPSDTGRLQRPLAERLDHVEGLLQASLGFGSALPGLGDRVACLEKRLGFPDAAELAASAAAATPGAPAAATVHDRLDFLERTVNNSFHHHEEELRLVHERQQGAQEALRRELEAARADRDSWRAGARSDREEAERLARASARAESVLVEEERGRSRVLERELDQFRSELEMAQARSRFEDNSRQTQARLEGLAAAGLGRSPREPASRPTPRAAASPRGTLAPAAARSPRERELSPESVAALAHSRSPSLLARAPAPKAPKAPEAREASWSPSPPSAPAPRERVHFDLTADMVSEASGLASGPAMREEWSFGALPAAPGAPAQAQGHEGRAGAGAAGPARPEPLARRAMEGVATFGRKVELPRFLAPDP